MKLPAGPAVTALVGLAAAFCASCEGSGAARGSSRSDTAVSDGDAAAPGAEGGPDAGAGSVLRAAQRPSRRYVLAHTKERCVVYWEDGDQRSEPLEVRCPRELESGERIRLAGQVCMREGAARERGVPVRCPTSLVALERADRLDAGLE